MKCTAPWRRGVVAVAALTALAAPGAAQADVLDKLTPALATDALDVIAKDRPVDVIVQFRPGVSADTADDIVESAGGEVSGELPLVNGITAEISAAEAAVLAASSAVGAVTVDGSVAPAAIDKGAVKLAQTYTRSTQPFEAWDKYTGKGIGVAVVDTGVQGNLTDFAVSRSDKTSRVVVNAVANDGATNADDRIGHGTHVAGLIAGNGLVRPSTDPNVGRYLGTAPEANIIGVKIADDAGAAMVSDVIRGIGFAVQNKATYNIRVLNLSLSSDVVQSYKIDPLAAAVERAWFSGIVVVAAAGNDGTVSGAVDRAPASDPFVVTVGGSDELGTQDSLDDVLASWSSRGTTMDGVRKPEVVAPGRFLVAPLSPGSAYAASCTTCVVDREYLRIGGTSMAAGVVSGIVAQLLEARPKLTPNEVKGLLQATLRGTIGTVNARGALDKTLSTDIVANQNAVPHEQVAAEMGSTSPNATWRAEENTTWTATWRSAELASWSATWRCADCPTSSDGSADPTATWRATWRVAE